MKNKEIKIIHFHPETTTNKGDIAIAQAIEDLLRENLNVKKYSHLNIEHLRRMNYPKLFYMISKDSRLSKFLPEFSPFRNFYNLLRKIQIKNIIKKINKNNLIVIGGGGIYSNFFFPLDEKILSRINIPMVIFSPGVNINLKSPGLTTEVKQSIKYLNQIARLSSVRDSNSLDILKKELNKDVKNIGCPSILLKEQESKKINIDSKNFNLGINIGFHVNSLNENKIKDIINLYKNIIKKLKLDKPVKIYYFKHHLREKYIIKKLKKIFKNLIIIDLPPKEMKYYYGKMDFVISMMLHSCILAFGSGTKFFNFAYNSKNLAFMRDIGREESLIVIDNLEKENIIYNKIIKSINKKGDDKKLLFEKKIKDYLNEIKLLIDK